MQEHKVKAARLDNIFLTRMSWGECWEFVGNDTDS
uniref:Uncharacterized protein n=1 Tax=Anguilla anguilla TaxID=7936 RepID=A0A0E9T638_ANGAN